MPSAQANCAIGSLTDIEDELDKTKRKHLKIDVVPRSQLPYRVVRKRNGCMLAMFETQIEADTYISSRSLTQLGIRL